MIYFIGTGVGGVDYLSVKATRILKKADIVLFTSLIDRKILTLCKKNCKFIDYKYISSEEVDAYFKNYAKSNVVYVTNGDFSVFGYTQQHFDFCKRESLSFEVVPGIPCFSAASSILANECILPNVSNVLAVTYFDTGGSKLDMQSIEKLAKLRGTIVIYMMEPNYVSVLQKRLLDGGYEEDMPVIALRGIYRENQRVFYSTIKDFVHLEKELDYMTLYLIGWVFAEEKTRNAIAKTPFVSDFYKTECYNSAGVFAYKLTDKVEGMSQFSVIKNKMEGL